VYLELDASTMLTRFEEAHGGISAVGPASVPPIDMPSHWAPNFAIIAFAVVLSAIVFAWGYSIWVTPAGDDEGATIATESTTPNAEQIALATELPERPAPPTVSPTEDIAPTATTEEAAAQVSGRQDAGDDADSTVDEGEALYLTGIAIAATNDIQLSLTVDNELVYEGILPGGQETDQYVGSTFALTTSSQASTNFINSCGDVSVMGDVDAEGAIEFAAHANSCPAPGE
jgi:hypothetical protein